MSRTTRVGGPALLGVLSLTLVSGCAVHVHGRHCYHGTHVHSSPPPTVHPRTDDPCRDDAARSGPGQSSTVEYDVSDDMVAPPEAYDDVEYDVREDMVVPPGLDSTKTPPGLAKKTPSGVPPGLAKKTPSGVPPGLAKKTPSGVPPGLSDNGEPPGQAKKQAPPDKDENETPPGQAKQTSRKNSGKPKSWK